MMTTRQEHRTKRAETLLKRAPELPLNELVHWLLDRTTISRITAYRLIKRRQAKEQKS